MPVLQFRTKGGQKVVRDQQAINREIAKQSDAIDSNKRAAIEFDRFVNASMKRNETAQERYNKLLAQAATAFDRGKLSADKYQKEVQAITNEMVNSEKRFKQFANTQKQTWSLADIKLFLGQLVLVREGMKLITDEFRIQRDLRQKAAVSQLGVGIAELGLIENLGPDEVDRVLAAVPGISQRAGLSRAVTASALAKGISTSNLETAISSTELAGRALPGRPEAVPGLVQALGAIAGITGTSDALTNYGVLAQVGTLGAVSVPAQQQEFIARGLVGVTTAAEGGARGADVGEAGAFISAISKQLKDFQGKRSISAATKIAAALGEFAQTERGRELDFGSQSFTDQILQASGDPEIARAVLQIAALGVETAPAGQLLLNRGSEGFTLYNQFLPSFGDSGQLRATGRAKLAAQDRGEFTGKVKRKQAFSNFIERRRLAAPDTLDEDELLFLQESLTRSGLPGVASRFVGEAAQAAGGIRPDEAIDILSAQRNRLRAAKPRAFANVGQAAAPPSEAELKQAALLDELVTELKKLNGTSDKILDEAKKPANGATELTGARG